MAFVCIACSKPRREHVAADHAYDGVRIPKGCQCSSLSDWGDRHNIPAICTAYWRMGGEYDDPVCGKCEHEEACHAAPRVRSDKPALDPDEVRRAVDYTKSLNWPQYILALRAAAEAWLKEHGK